MVRYNEARKILKRKQRKEKLIEKFSHKLKKNKTARPKMKDTDK